MPCGNEGTSESALLIHGPYVVFVGDVRERTFAKTGLGLVQWQGDKCVGQIRMSEAAVDLGIPEVTIDQAVKTGARSFIIGAAPIGGALPQSWIGVLSDAARAGLDIISGYHTKLSDFAQLRDIAKESGARLVDVRQPPSNLPIATGRKRTGLRLLTVGTDCALGKKYTALQLALDMRSAGLDAAFRATGQTGIMIAGGGIPMDAVKSDFVAGAAEILSPDNKPDHWDIIEGQGALRHPAYGAVSHGLLVGSQPDAIVVCHQAHRTHVNGWPDFKIPTIGDTIKLNLEIGKLTNPQIRCVGVSVNTSELNADARTDYLAELSNVYDLPCVDPLAGGADAIVRQIRQSFHGRQDDGARNSGLRQA